MFVFVLMSVERQSALVSYFRVGERDHLWLVYETATLVRSENALATKNLQTAETDVTDSACLLRWATSLLRFLT